MEIIHFNKNKVENTQFDIKSVTNKFNDILVSRSSLEKEINDRKVITEDEIKVLNNLVISAEFHAKTLKLI